MAVSTSSLVPFPITSLPSRLTAIYVSDKTSLVTTSSTGAVQRLNRAQSASFDTTTTINEVEEMGNQNRVGGADELGEVKWKIDFNDVGVRNAAHLVGSPFDPTTSGQTFTMGLTQWQNAQIDFIRLMAGPDNVVFASQYYQDCIIDNYSLDVKQSGLAMESWDGRGPNGIEFPGFVIPKTYLVTSTDVSNGYLLISNILGADEAPVKIYLPTAVATPGTVTPTGSGSGGTLPAGTYAYRVAARDFTGTTLASAETTPTTTTGSTSSIALAWTTVTGATSYDVYGRTVGGEVFLKNVLTNSYTDTNADTPDATQPLPTLNTTAVPSYWQQNGTVYFFKIEKLPAASLTATPVRYYEAFSPNGNTASYNAGTKHLTLSGTLVAGDLFRITFASYNTDSYPLTIPTTTPDILNKDDRAGITSRTIPVTISANKIARVQSASIKFSLKRDHVQGLGENSIVYGVPQVPDVMVDFDVKETDMQLLSALSTGSVNLTSQGGTIANDFQDINYITRIGLAVNIPFQVQLLDPFNLTTVLATYLSNNLAIKSIGYSSTNKADNSIKISGESITSSFTVTYQVPA